MGFDVSFDIPGSENSKAQDEIEFWLSEGLTADQILECVRTSK